MSVAERFFINTVDKAHAEIHHHENTAGLYGIGPGVSANYLDHTEWSLAM